MPQYLITYDQGNSPGPFNIFLSGALGPISLYASNVTRAQLEAGYVVAFDDSIPSSSVLVDNMAYGCATEEIMPFPTRTPSITPSVSRTPSVTPSISFTPTTTPSVTRTPTATPSSTPSISITSTATPSATPSVTPGVSVTPTPSITISRTPSATPAALCSTYFLANQDFLECIPYSYISCGGTSTGGSLCANASTTICAQEGTVTFASLIIQDIACN